MPITGFADTGTVYVNGRETARIASAEWKKHPKFEGVSTKDLFTGSQTDGLMSLMLVRIEPHHQIGDHIHQGKAELHEIIAGQGIGIVGDTRVDYRPGVFSWVPADVPHRIEAGESGLILLAKFTPPLN